MRPSNILAIAVFLQCSYVAGADKLEIEFDAASAKAFGDKMPLVVEAVRTKQEIEIRLSNVSTKHLVITKEPHGGSSSYQAADGSKLGEGGWITISTPPDNFDHIVLRPKREQNGKQALSYCSALKIPLDHPTAKKYVFDSTFSGYFPTIDKYLTFTIKGQLDISPAAKEDEQSVSEPSATRPELKSEDSGKPQPESEGRSR